MPETTPNNAGSYCNAELQNQNYSRYDCTNSEYARTWNTRTSRAQPQLPFDIFSGSQVRWQPTTHLQLKTAEQVRYNGTVPTLQPFPSTNLLAIPRLDGKIGSEPGILSRTYCTTASSIPEAQLSSRSESPPTASDDVLTIRTCIGPKNIRDAHQLGCRAFEKSRYKVYRLPGRFSASKPVSTAVTRRYSLNEKYHATTGLENKFRQVCSDSDTMPRVSRHNMGHKTQRNVLVGVEVPIATQSTSATAQIRQVVPKTVSNTDGETQLCHFCDQTRSSSLSNSASLQPAVVKKSSLPSSEHSAASSERHGMVVQFNRSEHADSYGRCYPSFNDRRVGHRLGSSDQRPVHYGLVDEPSDTVARQQKRNVRRICSYISRTPSPTKRAYSITDGQSDGGILYQQRRWHKIEEATRTNSTAAYGLGRAKRASSCPIFSRKIQRRSGRSFTSEGTSRVASHNESDIEYFSDVGDTRDGFVCVRDRTCDTEVCFDGRARSAGTAPQRVLSPMALPSGVVISTSESDSQSAQSPEPSNRTIHPNCTQMEQGVLAGRCSTTSSSTAVPDTRPASSSNRHANRLASAANSESAPRSMVDFGWRELLTEWTDQEQELLMSGWRPSTIKTYKPAWTRWKKWCESKSVNFKSPKADQVARYLAYLHYDIGLAYKTILVHKSVISTFTHLDSNVDLSSNFFIKHILKAISVARTKPIKPPIWNPKLLLQFMSGYRLDENNLYQVSRHTATLLLLASGRRVHDLTLLRIDNSSLIDEQTSIILWPVFGSKTDNANHQQSGWRLREHPDEKLNVVFWIRRLIQLSMSRRQNINHLFITARSDAKPASRTVIGGWVKSLLKDADIEASPGSVRSAVASLNWLENYPIDKILATGNWKTVHTFRNYYQRELMNENSSRRQSVSLSNYFDAVN